MKRTFDAIVLTIGAGVQRDLNIPGRQLSGNCAALEYLIQQNKMIAGNKIPANKVITAKDKKVIVIGGGDTGSDCVGTAQRQGAQEITQIEILPQPPAEREPYNPWPAWPIVLRTSSSQEEGCDRLWNVLTKEFIGDENQVKALRCVKLDWSETNQNGQRQFKEIPNSEFELQADLVLLAMGFVHVEHGALIQDFGLKLDDRNNILVDSNSMTSIPGVFAAGDCVLGTSLIVKAIYQGRQVAEGVDKYLQG